MCGRFTLHRSPEEIIDYFEVQQVLSPLLPRYNISPSQPIAVVMEQHVRILNDFKWGLVPFWANDVKIGNRMINARAESLAEKPSFKHALRRRRCIIPADGFYEWKKEGGYRRPMHFRRRDGRLIGFAGLWEEWQSPDGSVLRTCAIITVEANRFMAAVHHRMPAILDPEDYARWLDPSIQDPTDLLRLLRPCPEHELEAFLVSGRVNKPAVDDPGCIEPRPEEGSSRRGD